MTISATMKRNPQTGAGVWEPCEQSIFIPLDRFRQKLCEGSNLFFMLAFTAFLVLMLTEIL